MNEDFLKVIVTSIAIITFFIQKRKENPTDALLMGIGLIFLFCASILDFTDGIPALENTPILSRSDPWHDVLEDQIFDTTGLLLFITGAFRALGRKH